MCRPMVRLRPSHRLVRPRVHVLALIACAVVLGAAGCGSSPSAPSSEPAYSQTDLQVGTGPTAAVGNTVTVNYTGWLYDSTKADFKGAQFDSSLSAGRAPLVFVLG